MARNLYSSIDRYRVRIVFLCFVLLCRKMRDMAEDMHENRIK